MMESLKRFAKKKRRLFCFGTGYWADVISLYCKNYGINIFGYVVSSEKYRQESFRGRSVYVIGQGILSKEDGIIIPSIEDGKIEEASAILSLYVDSQDIFFAFSHKDIVDASYRLRDKARKYVTRKRKKMHLFNFLVLCRDVSVIPVYAPPEEARINRSNSVYGQDRVIKKYLGIKNYDVRQSTILHAAQYLPEFTQRELHPPDGNIFCMSKESFKNITHCCNIYETGPYIQYVKSIISRKQLRNIKKKIGRTLLVAPSHVPSNSNPEENAYSCEELVREIERIRAEYDFDTVMVCLGPGIYQRDIRLYRYYRAKGCKVVTAGKEYDLNFLARLRSFLFLADTVMVNDMTTIIGYAIYLERPVYYYSMDINNEYAATLNREVGYCTIAAEDWQQLEAEFIRLFGTYSEKITAEQVRFIERGWGKRRRLSRNP